MDHKTGFLDALDAIREGMRDLNGLVEGSDDQAAAVLALTSAWQDLQDHARLLRGDYRHARTAR